jgi:hypothetical protein
MKVAIIFLVIGIALLCLFLYSTIVHSNSKSIDLHLFDTYFIIDKLNFIIGVVLFLLTLFSLGGVIGTGFRSKAFLLTFFIAFVLNGLVAWWMYNQFYGG